ncbi:hypothetical protein [Streptomyces sp. NPDC059080]|uniref:hypothetical protein n=1 Tax=Streptomyces sp. NPDC059080 TaxID=3346718 RepID=UPI0036A17BDE
MIAAYLVVALLRGGVQAHARAVVDDTALPWWLDGTGSYGLAAPILATRLLPPTAPRATPHPGALPASALVLAAAGALLGGSREDALARPLVFAAAAFLCAVLIWSTARKHLAGPAPLLQR